MAEEGSRAKCGTVEPQSAREHVLRDSQKS